MLTLYKDPKYFKLVNLSDNPLEINGLIKAHGFACHERYHGRSSQLIVLGQYTPASPQLVRHNHGSLLILPSQDDRLTKMQQQWATERYSSDDKATSEFKPQAVKLPQKDDYNAIYEIVNRYFIEHTIFADDDHLASNFLEKCKAIS